MGFIYNDPEHWQLSSEASPQMEVYGVLTKRDLKKREHREVHPHFLSYFDSPEYLKRLLLYKDKYTYAYGRLPNGFLIVERGQLVIYHFKWLLTIFYITTHSHNI